MTLSNCLVSFFFILILSSCSTKENKNYSGVNLYTFRNELKESPKETLKKISDIGYKYIEDVGYSNGKFYGMKPLEYKEYLNQLGLIPISSHQGGITYENADTIIKDLKAIGSKYLVIPIPPMGYFTVDEKTNTLGMTCDSKTLTDILNNLGEKCKSAGLELLYHNHDFEFKTTKNGIIPFDYLLENTNPDYVNFEIDVYWTAKVKVNPIEYFEKYPGRFKAWHLKDIDSKGRFAPVGTGNINFKELLSKKQLSGMKYYFVEQDITYDNMTPIESIKISLNNTKKFGYK